MIMGFEASNIFEAYELCALNYISKYVNKDDAETDLCMGRRYTEQLTKLFT